MPTSQALRLAREQELDLIEISPKAEPPVVRIADYQKFLYQQKRKAKELKAKTVKVTIKEIRFGPQTDDHDYNFKLRHAQNFSRRGGESEGITSFQGAFDSLQGAGGDTAAPFRYRPRRDSESGNDAQTGGKTYDDDARAEAQKIGTKQYGSSCRRKIR